jgi:hypothetical protein
VIVLFCSQVNYKNSSVRLAARRRRRINAAHARANYLAAFGRRE